MQKNLVLAILGLMVFAAVPCHGFVNYLFGGDSSKEAVENSAVGDIRAWWSGNPAYQFNPYYSGPSSFQSQGQAGQSAPAMAAPGAYGGYSPQGSGGYGQAPPPNIQYVPSPQAPPANPYGQGYPQQYQAPGQPMYGGPPPVQQQAPPMYGPQYQQPAQQVYGPPQAAGPQYYQGGQPAYQGTPGGYAPR